MPGAPTDGLAEGDGVGPQIPALRQEAARRAPRRSRRPPACAARGTRRAPASPTRALERLSGQADLKHVQIFLYRSKGLAQLRSQNQPSYLTQFEQKPINPRFLILALKLLAVRVLKHRIHAFLARCLGNFSIVSQFLF